MATEKDPRTPIRAFVGLMGTVASICGLAVLPPFPGRLVVFGALGAAGVGSIAVATWRSLRRKPKFLVRADLCAAEFDVSWALGQRIYAQSLRKAYPTREQADKWLSQYSKGVFQAFDHRARLWGYFSLWPLTDDACNRLKRGEVGEEDLDETMIAPAAEAPFTYWYIADILKQQGTFDSRVRPNVFSEYLKALMIFEGLRHLSRNRQVAPTFEMIALAVSRPGKQMLKDFHFQQVLPTPPNAPKHPVYVRTFTRAALQLLLSELGQTIRRCESDIEAALR